MLHQDEDPFINKDKRYKKYKYFFPYKQTMKLVYSFPLRKCKSLSTIVILL